jgi:hypothetical protein
MLLLGSRNPDDLVDAPSSSATGPGSISSPENIKLTLSKGLTELKRVVPSRGLMDPSRLRVGVPAIAIEDESNADPLRDRIDGALPSLRTLLFAGKLGVRLPVDWAIDRFNPETPEPREGMYLKGGTCPVVFSRLSKDSEEAKVHRSASSSSFSAR